MPRPPRAERSDAGFLAAPAPTPEGQRLFDDDVAGVGHVTNVSRLWAYLPATLQGLSDLMEQSTRAGSLTFRQRSVLVTAAASTLGDSYCSLAWGKKLAEVAGPDVPKLNELRAAWLNAATAEEQKRIAVDIQVQFFRDVTHVPLGQFFQPAAFHKGLVDIQPGWPVMHSVRRA